MAPRFSRAAHAMSSSRRRFTSTTTRRNAGGGADDDSSDGDESDGSASGRADAPRGSTSQPLQPAAPSQSRLRGSRLSLSPNRTPRPETPDHYYRPSLSAQLMAAVRRVCGEGDRYFLSRYQVASGLRLQMLLQACCVDGGTHALEATSTNGGETWSGAMLVAVDAT